MKALVGNSRKSHEQHPFQVLYSITKHRSHVWVHTWSPGHTCRRNVLPTEGGGGGGGGLVMVRHYFLAQRGPQQWWPVVPRVPVNNTAPCHHHQHTAGTRRYYTPVCTVCSLLGLIYFGLCLQFRASWSQLRFIL